VSGLSRAAALLALAVALCLVSVATATAAAPLGRGSEFRLPPGTHADALTLGPDGNIWFGGTKYGPDSAVDVVGRVTPDGQISEFTLPVRGEAELGISSITAGQNEDLFFTEPNANRLGHITTGGEISDETLPNPDSRPRTIATAPDGTLWFTEEGGDRLGHFNPFAGTLGERKLGPGARPTGLAVRADGTIWIAEPGQKGFAMVMPGGGSEFGIPFPRAEPNDVVPGPEGNVWFTEEGGPWLGRVTSAAQTRSRFERLGVPARRGTQRLAFGPAGDFWYTSGSLIGSMSPDYWTADLACLPGGCDLTPAALAVGAEGSLWYSTAPAPDASRLTPGAIGTFKPPRIMAKVNRVGGGLSGRRVKLRIFCSGGAAGKFCRGPLRLYGRLGGGRPQTLGYRRLSFRVHTGRRFGVILSRSAAVQLRREGRLSVRVAIKLQNGRRTSSRVLLRARD
jgi:virginiamycin B lyase